MQMNNRQHPTQAVILAGGRGTRLAPITDTISNGLDEAKMRQYIKNQQDHDFIGDRYDTDLVKDTFIVKCLRIVYSMESGLNNNDG